MTDDHHHTRSEIERRVQEQRLEEHRERIREKAQTPEGREAMGAILSMCDEMERAEGLSNHALANDLLNTVWAELTITGRESALLGEAIARLRGERNG